jgi:hypothetical protein
MGLGSFEYLCVDSVLVSFIAERTMATELNVLWVEIAMGISGLVIVLVLVEFMLTGTVKVCLLPLSVPLSERTEVSSVRKNS